MTSNQTSKEELFYIDFRLYFFGSISRSDLMERFGISSASATRKLTEYKENFGENLKFSNSSKSYIISNNFKPRFSHNLEQSLTAITKGFGDSRVKVSDTFIPCETPLMFNRPDIDVLASITRAIYLKKATKLKYSSFSSGETHREIVPFALINDGVRWHTRAYCRNRDRFSDFVLTRMRDVEVLMNSSVEKYELPEFDNQWSRIVELDIIPHPNPENNDGHPEIIEKDFGMVDGILKIKMRDPIIGYALRILNVDCSPDRSMVDKAVRLCVRDPLALYGVSTSFLAPGYRPPQTTNS